MEKIREAAHEVQRPVFYAIGIIITAYLPIFTLQRVEGRLFKPMAWTVAFALLGALMFSMLLAPVLSSLFFPKGTKEWHNPVMTFLTRMLSQWPAGGRSTGAGSRWAWRCPASRTIYLATSVLGSEFLPHLDEGAIWVRGITGAQHRPDRGNRVANRRGPSVLVSRSPQCTSQVGRPDDGTDTTGFFNTEFFVDLKPKEEWRPVFHQDKDELIAAMNRELEKIPGVTWGFSQPISDNMEEAVSGVKGELAIKVFGDDLRTLEAKADEIMGVMRGIKGIQDLGLFRVIGQPNLNLTVNRAEGRPLPDQRRGRAGRGADRHRRQRADAGAAGRAALRSGAALSAAVPRHQGSHRKHPPAVALRASACRWRSSAIFRCWTALRKSIARQPALCRDQIQRARPRSGRRRRGSHQEGRQAGKSCRPAITSTGRASTNRSSARQGAWPSSFR
jgi:hypothetical protein